nr:hypothetical protein 23 [Pelagibacteraceae bacterium]
MPSATTTRSGKTIKNRKVIAKRKAARGETENKKRARKLTGKKTKATGARVTRAGKTVTNKKVVAKRRANQGKITNKKRALKLGQTPNNRRRARKLAGKKVSAGVRMTRAGKEVTNKKVIAKRKAAQGKITNKKRATKLGQINNRLRARKMAGKKTKTRGA